MARSISSTIFHEGTNDVISVDPQLEQMILNNVQRSEHGSYVNIEHSVLNQIIKSLTNEMERITLKGQIPIILTSPIVRTYFKQLVSSHYPDLIVVSYNEIEKTVQIKSNGMVRIS